MTIPLVVSLTDALGGPNLRSGLGRDEYQRLVRTHQPKTIVNLGNRTLRVAETAQLALLFVAPAFQRSDVRPKGL